jgi:hypothetical protein
MIVTKHYDDYITYTIFEFDHDEYIPRMSFIPETMKIKKIETIYTGDTISNYASDSYKNDTEENIRDAIKDLFY